MKHIKIVPENRDQIVAALAAVNGKATAHTFVHFAQIMAVAEYAQKTVMALLGSKKTMVGALVLSTSSEQTAKSYKYQRQGTAITLVYKTTGWHISCIKVASLYCNQGGDRQIVLTPAQSDKATADFSKKWVVAR